MIPSARRWLLASVSAAVVLGFAPDARAQVTVTVDAAASRRAISPLVYGVHFASTGQLQDLNATVNRLGGNSVGRYNWQQNVDNRGSDYFFLSIPYPSASQGERGDTFITDTKAGGAEPFLSMPMVGWVAKTNGNRDQVASFSVGTYGAFSDALGDAGNGCKPGAPLDNYHPCGGIQQGGTAYPFTANDPNDASVAADAAFQQDWMQHVKDTHGAANAGGLKYWGLDNEPSIWHTVYWDVHPLGATAGEMRDKMIDYGSRIKAVDPGAQVLGPEEWGWDGYFYSGRDQQMWGRNECSGFDCPDRVAIGGDYVPWLLSEMKQHEIDTGTRVLDMLTLHVYPAGGEVDNGGSDISSAMQGKRNRSTRALWDVNYLDESWINTQVKLIPRMRAWVAGSYPGTKLGLTEYDWGAENHINGATAEADLLGIFGREGLDMAIRWVVPATNSPVYNAFKMYRNYDGSKSTFGETSVSASAAQPDQLSAFAAQRADGALTVMVINKVTSAASLTVSLANFTPSTSAKVWQLTSANVIQAASDVTVASNALSTTVPAQSITLFVIGAAAAPAAPTITSFSPTSGPVGTSVMIMGTGFTGASAVRFNGVSAAFSVGSDTSITAAVRKAPSGTWSRSRAALRDHRGVNRTRARENGIVPPEVATPLLAIAAAQCLLASHLDRRIVVGRPVEDARQCAAGHRAVPLADLLPGREDARLDATGVEAACRLERPPVSSTIDEQVLGFCLAHDTDADRDCDHRPETPRRQRRSGRLRDPRVSVDRPQRECEAQRAEERRRGHRQAP